MSFCRCLAQAKLIRASLSREITANVKQHINQLQTDNTDPELDKTPVFQGKLVYLRALHKYLIAEGNCSVPNIPHTYCHSKCEKGFKISRGQYWGGRWKGCGFDPKDKTWYKKKSWLEPTPHSQIHHKIYSNLEWCHSIPLEYTSYSSYQTAI